MLSNQPAIAVRGLSKSYTIRRNVAKHSTLADALVDRIKHPFRRAEKEVFWALRDLNFEVAPGEIVGIIGRNGAGKSTLLKILSRITRPTSGEVELHGRVGSLLEVGTGFHQELTGRENIYLSGTILGMKRREIKGQFEAIIEFAGVEQFLDTPVKRYSSGMYVRLAFAVAAHLNPEILLVDEVLAVGDANFQKKCLGKMEELGSQGRTVIFVSHSMPTIHRLCNRVALLDKGHLVADGSPNEVTRRYLHSDSHSQAEHIWQDRTTSPGDAVARLKAVRVCNSEGKLTDTIDIRNPFSVEVEYWNLQSKIHPTVSLWFVNTEGICLFVTNDFNNLVWWKQPRKVGSVRSVCHVPGNFLAEGQIFILAAIASYNPDVVHVLERDIVTFLIVDRSEGDGVRCEYAGHWPGVVRPLLEWSSEHV